MTGKIFSMSNVASVAVAGSASVLWLCWYMGIFRKITFQKESLGPVKFYHRKGQGQYSSVGPAFQAALDYLQTKGLSEDTNPTAGIYYDHNVPPGVEPRYAVGFLYSEDEKDENNEKLQKEFINDGWELLDIPETQTLSSRFPKKQVPISCMISAMKTYPAYRKSGHPMPSGGCMEIYEKGDVITYFPQGSGETFIHPTGPSCCASSDDKKEK